MTAPRAMAVAEARAEGAPGLVAVVDDDASVRRSVCNLLRSLNFRVEAFSSAEDFLDSDLEATDCLVLDIRLPGISGLELLDRLTRSRFDIEIVMLTAQGNAETRRRAVELGAAAFLAKPFRSEELLEAVKTGVERRT